MRFSKKEITDLFYAWIIISVAFAILFSGGIGFLENLTGFGLALVFSALTVGVAFLFHELMHKKIAQQYGLWAEFRAFYGMLFLSVLFAFFGFIIAAPGAVMIQSSRLISKEKQGKISFAGPVSNIILGMIFLILINTVPLLFNQEFVLMFLKYGILINGLLAAFNLIPFGPFDGKDVYDWNKRYYFAGLIFAILLLVLGFGY